MNNYHITFKNCSVSERFWIEANTSLAAINKAKRLLNNTALQYAEIYVDHPNFSKYDQGAK